MKKIAYVASLIAVIVCAVPSDAAPDVDRHAFVERCTERLSLLTQSQDEWIENLPSGPEELRRMARQMCECGFRELMKIAPISHRPYAERGFFLGLDTKNQETLDAKQSKIISDARSEFSNIGEVADSIRRFSAAFDRSCVSN